MKREIKKVIHVSEYERQCMINKHHAECDKLQKLKEPYEALELGAFDTEALQDIVENGCANIKQRYLERVTAESRGLPKVLQDMAMREAERFDNDFSRAYKEYRPNREICTSTAYEVQEGNVVLTERKKQAIEDETSNTIRTEAGLQYYEKMQHLADIINEAGLSCECLYMEVGKCHVDNTWDYDYFANIKK